MWTKRLQNFFLAIFCQQATLWVTINGSKMKKHHVLPVSATGESTGWNWPPSWKRSREAKRQLITSYLNLFYPTLKKFLKSETMILGGGPCSQSVRRKHWTQSQKDNRNNLIHHLDRREASSRLHSVVAYSVSNKTWAKCPASFSSGFWSASIQKEPPPLSFDFVTHSASGFDFLEAVLHLFCSDQSVAKVLAECTRKAGGQP